MQVLQGMSTNQMIIILPSALIAMYLIITLQKHLCGHSNKYLGLILPAICFVAATILAIRPLLISNPSEYSGLVMFCFRMWLAFNIPTLVFGFQYYRQRKILAALSAAEEAEEAEQTDVDEDASK